MTTTINNPEAPTPLEERCNIRLISVARECDGGKIIEVIIEDDRQKKLVWMVPKE
jgi:hypothetical protein